VISAPQVSGLFKYFALALSAVMLSLSLQACGGGGDSLTVTDPQVVPPSSVIVNASVSGLNAGNSFVLQDSLGNTLTVSANGTSSFANPIAVGAGYSVSVRTQPVGQTCSLAASTGVGVAGASVNVQITCSVNSYRVSGSLSGLSGGNTVSFALNGTNLLSGGNGAFDFGALIAFNGSYAVTIATQPNGQTCTVNNGSGAGVVADVSGVQIVCATNTYTLSGSLSGLSSGQSVSLLSNGADALTRNANGSFQFATPIAFGGNYAITVGTQPVGQTCSVSNGSGSNVAANVSNISVVCAANSFTIGGSLSGLDSGAQVTLLNSAGDPLTRSSNGSFQFATPVAFGGSYAVTVGTQPANGQNCSVSNGSGSSLSANVSNVQVTCVNSFALSGSISGLGSVTGLVLANGADTLAISANASTFTFAGRVPQGSNYAVTVQSQPPLVPGVVGAPASRTVVCSITGGGNNDGSGTMGSASVTNLQVSCTNTLEFPVGTTVWNVPAGVTQLLSVAVTGGGGGGGNELERISNIGAGGSSIRILQTLIPVTPGEAFFVGTGGGGARGGFLEPSGQQVRGGGGGGGASWWVPDNADPFTDARSMVAGGGGGAGTFGLQSGGFVYPNPSPGFTASGFMNGGSALESGPDFGRGGSTATASACTSLPRGGHGAWALTGDRSINGGGSPGGIGGAGGTVTNAANFLVASGGGDGRGTGGGGGGSGAANRCGEGGFTIIGSQGTGGGGGASFLPTTSGRHSWSPVDNGGNVVNGFQGGNGSVVIRY
jgi:hypothetical protein